jgi:adenylate cyclase
MADLIAQGTSAQQRWRRPLPEARVVVLGRSPDTWAPVPWDEQVSRRHAELCWRGGRLQVRRLPEARNPLYVRGEAQEAFELRPGGCFVCGQTTFTLTDDHSVLAPQPLPVTEQAFPARELQRVPFRDADRRLEILSRLPEIISRSASDPELFIQLGNLLLAGIPQADAVAVVAVEPGATAGQQVEVLYWDRRLSLGGDFRPSEQLILRAVTSQESTSHLWGGSASGPEGTAGASADWAFCTPLRSESCPGWGLYVAGRFQLAADLTPSLPRPATGPPGAPDPADLRADLKFTELVAAVLGSLRQVRLLQHRQTVLSQFFSPSVLSTLGTRDADRQLTPRETDVSVLFCDLRGFSQEADRAADDLLGLLDRVSKALGVMTRHILDQGGVIADFQGDAALGFWGWPVAQADVIARVCQAALGIRAQFEASARRVGHPLAGFRMGIGIATGRAVAGKIGTDDQAKIGVFGPVVNLASRLEGMTKFLHTPILLGETTARLARQQVPPEVGRFRRVAKVRPYGLDNPLIVTELLPPAGDYPELGDDHLAYYEEALDALLAGQWPRAYDLLHRIPPGDRVKDFLVVYIAQHNRTAPPDWDGVIPLTRKG